jgi:hypothetical protein
MLRCPDCRTRRASFVSLLAHLRKTRHRACDCGCGRPYPHRPGSRGCIAERWDDLFDMPRAKLGSALCPF